MRYFLSDYDWVYGWKDGQMYLCGKGGLKPVKGVPDPLWSGISESDVKDYVARMPF